MSARAFGALSGVLPGTGVPEVIPLEADEATARSFDFVSPNLVGHTEGGLAGVGVMLSRAKQTSYFGGAGSRVEER